MASLWSTLSSWFGSKNCKILQVHMVLFVSVVCGGLLETASKSNTNLTLDYYKSTCPSVLGIVRKEMECAVLSDPRNAAFILRLHFHDCFVQGCDGSVLLDDTITLKGEKKAPQNKHSLNGFKIIDRIKNWVESECPGIVSCADILTIAARDAVLLVGGPYWDVPLGRKDSKSGGYELVETNMPTADETFLSIISKFLSQGLSVTDMVALSGAHTIGKARCVNFRRRIYGDFAITSSPLNPISQVYLNNLKSICPPIEGENNNETAMDYLTPHLFDNSYYHTLLRGEGLLNSDQNLYSSLLAIEETRELVEKYAANPIAFFQQFAESMVKMGNITNPEAHVNGEVRKTCRFVNA
ncbi:PREDICTED: peroxidase 11-like [Ipomoea nil]|uniref:peroxidase 11-like n=1 Tax=Ipomoea nil TaxID=35883 RepID=UPI0009016114|nr:PREDICTED: peroxidase 11-like [Ipomoea nil]